MKINEIRAMEISPIIHSEMTRVCGIVYHTDEKMTDRQKFDADFEMMKNLAFEEAKEWEGDNEHQFVMHVIDVFRSRQG